MYASFSPIFYLPRSSKISGRDENRRHGLFAPGNCCRMNVSWSDWKVRQGRAYSVTLPPACGRRQGYRIMPCPFGLSSHSRRHNQSLQKNNFWLKVLVLCIRMQELSSWYALQLKRSWQERDLHFSFCNSSTVYCLQLYSIVCMQILSENTSLYKK